MSSPRIFFLASVAVLTFGPGLISPSQASSPQRSKSGVAAMAAEGPLLIVAQNAPAASGQDQDGMPDQPAPPKPYKPVSVKPPKASSDASFEAFRKKLADVAHSKDKEALKGLIGDKVFHLDGEGNDKADKDKSGIDYFSELLDLDSGETFGWDSLNVTAGDSTADALENHAGVICGPGAPIYDDDAFEKLLENTGTDEFEWAYSVGPIEARASDKPDAPVLEKVSGVLLRILPAQGQSEGEAAESQSEAPSSDAIPIVLPSGKTGYVPGAKLRPLSTDQLCYGKEGGSWKIVGYVDAE